MSYSCVQSATCDTSAKSVFGPEIALCRRSGRLGKLKEGIIAKTKKSIKCLRNRSLHIVHIEVSLQRCATEQWQ